MKNLEQIRAENALKASVDKDFKGVNDGEVVKKIPTMIRENGFLGALAFAMEKASKGTNDYGEVFLAIRAHLVSLDRFDELTESTGDVHPGLKDFIAYLVKRDAAALRMITTESMEYLNYLRRFASMEK